MVDKNNKAKFNELFDDYLELEDQKVSIREAQKDIKDEMAVVLSENKTIVGKVVSYLIKQRSSGGDELDRIYEIVEELEG